MTASIVGPFKEYRLVVDGWQVPFMEAIEEDGGRVLFIIDKRLGFSVSVTDFEQVAELVANAVAVGLGMSAHPPADLPREDHQRWMGHVPFLLRPSRLTEIVAVEAESSPEKL